MDEFVKVDCGSLKADMINTIKAVQSDMRKTA
jgi:hypothetical protein